MSSGSGRALGGGGGGASGADHGVGRLALAVTSCPGKRSPRTFSIPGRPRSSGVTAPNDRPPHSTRSLRISRGGAIGRGHPREPQSTGPRRRWPKAKPHPSTNSPSAPPGLSPLEHSHRQSESSNEATLNPAPATPDAAATDKMTVYNGQYHAWVIGRETMPRHPSGRTAGGQWRSATETSPILRRPIPASPAKA